MSIAKPQQTHNKDRLLCTAAKSFVLFVAASVLLYLCPFLYRCEGFLFICSSFCATLKDFIHSRCCATVKAFCFICSCFCAPLKGFVFFVVFFPFLKKEKMAQNPQLL